jgi:hypothetical protein
MTRATLKRQVDRPSPSPPNTRGSGQPSFYATYSAIGGHALSTCRPAPYVGAYQVNAPAAQRTSRGMTPKEGAFSAEPA